MDKSMDIIESNKLIAEFMGGTFEEDKKWNFCMTDFGLKTIGGYGLYKSLDLKFHKSWNWLMPVVEKIKDTEYVSHIGWGIDLGFFVIEVDIDEESKTLESYRNHGTNIECVYKAVVEFIKWYNQINKNELN